SGRSSKRRSPSAAVGSPEAWGRLRSSECPHRRLTIALRRWASARRSSSSAEAPPNPPDPPDPPDSPPSPLSPVAQGLDRVNFKQLKCGEPLAFESCRTSSRELAAKEAVMTTTKLADVLESTAIR